MRAEMSEITAGLSRHCDDSAAASCTASRPCAQILLHDAYIIRAHESRSEAHGFRTGINCRPRPSAEQGEGGSAAGRGTRTRALAAATGAPTHSPPLRSSLLRILPPTITPACSSFLSRASPIHLCARTLAAPAVADTLRAIAIPPSRLNFKILPILP